MIGPTASGVIPNIVWTLSAPDAAVDGPCAGRCGTAVPPTPKPLAKFTALFHVSVPLRMKSVIAAGLV